MLLSEDLNLLWNFYSKRVLDQRSRIFATGQQLSYAAEHGHGAIVETLLDAKAGPESFADDIAVLLAKDNGHEAIVQMLHAAGVQC